MVAGARDGAAAAAVVDQRVARLLEHPLLVADDDLRRAQLQQPLEPVVAVDDAPVEVVQVGGREAAAVELHHRAQVRRDDRQHGQDHPLGPGAAAAERLDEAQPLDGLLAAHAGRGPDLAVELLRERLEVHAQDPLADGLGAHAGAEQAGRATHAAAVLAVELAEVPAVERRLRAAASPAWSLLISSLALRISSLRPSASALRRSFSVSSCGVELQPQVLDLLLDAGLLGRLALLDLGVDALDLVAGRPCAGAASGLLVGLVALGHDDLGRRRRWRRRRPRSRAP